MLCYFRISGYFLQFEITIFRHICILNFHCQCIQIKCLFPDFFISGISLRCLHFFHPPNMSSCRFQLCHSILYLLLHITTRSFICTFPVRKHIDWLYTFIIRSIQHFSSPMISCFSFCICHNRCHFLTIHRYFKDSSCQIFSCLGIRFLNMKIKGRCHCISGLIPCIQISIPFADNPKTSISW